MASASTDLYGPGVDMNMSHAETTLSMNDWPSEMIYRLKDIHQKPLPENDVQLANSLAARDGIVTIQRMHGETQVLLEKLAEAAWTLEPEDIMLEVPNPVPGIYNEEVKAEIIPYRPQLNMLNAADQAYLKRYGVKATSGRALSKAREYLERVASGEILTGWRKLIGDLDIDLDIYECVCTVEDLRNLTFNGPVYGPSRRGRGQRKNKAYWNMRQKKDWVGSLRLSRTLAKLTSEFLCERLSLQCQ